MPTNRLRAAKRRHAEPPTHAERERARRAVRLAEFDAEFSDLLLEGGDAERIPPLLRRVGGADFGVLAFCDRVLAALPPCRSAEAADRAEVRAAALKIAEEFARLPLRRPR